MWRPGLAGVVQNCARLSAYVQAVEVVRVQRRPVDSQEVEAGTPESCEDEVCVPSSFQQRRGRLSVDTDCWTHATVAAQRQPRRDAITETRTPCRWWRRHRSISTVRMDTELARRWLCRHAVCFLALKQRLISVFCFNSDGSYTVVHN